VRRWKTPKKVFLCSMGDLFHKDVTDAQIQMTLEMCAIFPEHTFQILTKRPERCALYNFRLTCGWVRRSKVTLCTNALIIWRYAMLR